MEREFSSDSVLVEGLFVEPNSDGTAPSAEVAVEVVHEEMVRAVSDDSDYWLRISSAVMMEEKDTATAGGNENPAAVPSPSLDGQSQTDITAVEWESFLAHWAKQGRSVDLIGDFHQHIRNCKARLDRRLAKNKRKEEAAARRAAWRARAWTSAASHSRSYATAVADVASVPTEPVDVTALPFDVAAALRVLSSVDEVFLSSIPQGGIADALPELDAATEATVVAVFDHMMRCFEHPKFVALYHGTPLELRQPRLVFGADVPSYFANVVDSSMYRRKVLSMAGLRNLIRYGPRIYKDLKEHQFQGNPNVYASRGDVGLQLMRRVTGNVVDLDTTVLRCTCKATLNAINVSNQFKNKRNPLAEQLPVYHSPDDFGGSPQAAEIAVHASKELLSSFASLLGLKTPAERESRHISLDELRVLPRVVAAGEEDNLRAYRIPRAMTNTDRGMFPIWHYINVGQNSFHCNVPTLDDVNGALLKAPFHCAQQWAMMLHLLHQADGEPTETCMLERMADFFENCVVDSCFNMKWKAIEEFAAKTAHEGTIVDVLQRVQMANQALFTCELFDSDDEAHSKETALMWSLVGNECVGRSVCAGGRIRCITQDDVAAWVKDPAVVL